MKTELAWLIGGGLWVIAAALIWAVLHGSRKGEDAEQGRVALQELEVWRATASRLARAPLPRVGLPWSTSDADGDMLIIRRHETDPERLIVCVRYVDAGGDGWSGCVEIDWDARTQAAAALLSVSPSTYTPVGEP